MSEVSSFESIDQQPELVKEFVNVFISNNLIVISTMKMMAACLFTKLSSTVMFSNTTGPNTNISGYLALFNNLFVLSTASHL